MEDQYDIELKEKFGILFSYKFFFLPSTIIFPCFIIIDEYNNYTYIFFSTFTTLMILTWVFPTISKFIYSKPIYYDDLISSSRELSHSNHNQIIYDLSNSNKFKMRFLLFQQFMISIIISLVADYINSRVNNHKYSTVELFGLVGGILSLMIKIIKVLGSIYLYILYNIKLKEDYTINM